MHHFLDIADLKVEELVYILDLSKKIKLSPDLYSSKLKGKNVIILLEKQSTRTRLSFELGAKELGANCSVLSKNDLQLSRGESLEDTAKVFDRYADVVVFRTSSHDKIVTIKENCIRSSVINALTDKSHPCQIIADLLTIMENGLSLDNINIAWIGDINNVLYSWIEASDKFGFSINVCCPKEIIHRANPKPNISFFSDKYQAVKNCDVIVTDTWVSMGEEKEKAKMFTELTVTKDLMSHAKNGALFLHCLPAYRGLEVDEEIMEDPFYSKIIFDEAENRLHAQKAIMMWCLNVN